MTRNRSQLKKFQKLGLLLLISGSLNIFLIGFVVYMKLFDKPYTAYFVQYKDKGSEHKRA